MKKRLSSLWIAFLLSSGIAIGEETPFCGEFLVERIYLMPFVFKYADTIGLDEEQKEKLKEFVRENEKEIKKNRELLKYLSRKAKLMIIQGAKEERLKEVLGDVTYIKTELSLMNAKSVRFIKSVLTEDQFNRLKDIIAIRLFEISQ